MKRLITASLLVGLIVAVSAERKAGAESLSEGMAPIPLADATACWNSCQRCQEPCNEKSAGSERDRCKEQCTTSAIFCCSAVGRKPPTSNVSCACM